MSRQNDRLLTMRDIAKHPKNNGREKTPYSKVSIYRMIGDGKFPPGFLLGKRKRVWWESDIDKWIREQEGAGR